MKPVDLHDPDGEEYRGFRIKEMHAIVAVDPGNDSEGIPAYMTPAGPIPLIATDRVRLDEIVAMAQQVSDGTRMTFKIVKFIGREDIGEIKPRTLS